MDVFWQLVLVFLSFYTFLLIARLVVEIVKGFAREWFPTGVVAVILEALFVVTDPPLKALRKVIPPVRIGQVSLDLSFIVLFLLIMVIRSLITSIAL